LGLFDGLAASPQLARTLAAHVRAFDDGRIPARTRELIALMVAWLNACADCTCVHEEIARGIGVDEATLAELGDFARSKQYSEAERAALAAAIALTREPRALPPAVWNALHAHYDEAACVEIIALIGLNNYVSRLNNSLPRSQPVP
jgi:AhpD family alkylhydroperoxidase